MCASGRAVGRPQNRMTGSVVTIEQHFILEDREIGWVKSTRIGTADAGEFVRSSRGAVGLPQTMITALEQHFVLEHCEVLNGTILTSAKSSDFVRTSCRAIGRPQANLYVSIRAHEQHFAIEDREIRQHHH